MSDGLSGFAGICQPAHCGAPRVFSRQCQTCNYENVEDPYQVLGVQSSATVEQIRSAYYEKSKLVHPDRLNAGAQYAASPEAFHRLSDAYALLSNPTTRKQYDQYVTSQRNGVWSNPNTFSHKSSAMDDDFIRYREIYRSHSPRFHRARSNHSTGGFYPDIDPPPGFTHRRQVNVWNSNNARRSVPLYLHWILQLCGLTVAMISFYCITMDD